MYGNGATLSIAVHQRILCPTPLVRTHAAPSEHLLHAVPQAIRKTRLAWGARHGTASVVYVERAGSSRACRTIASWRRTRRQPGDNTTLSLSLLRRRYLLLPPPPPPPKAMDPPLGLLRTHLPGYDTDHREAQYALSGNATMRSRRNVLPRITLPRANTRDVVACGGKRRVFRKRSRGDRRCRGYARLIRTGSTLETCSDGL